MKMLFFLCCMLVIPASFASTFVSINGTEWHVNGRPTFQGKQAQGLLMNQRMINGIFDDYNQGTRNNWAYPDTKRWDPNRNVAEFMGNFSRYMSFGMNAFTVGLQGGCPYGYCGGQPWISTAIDYKSGSLDTAWMQRLTQVLSKADQNGMVVIIQVFYQGQANRMSGSTAIKTGLQNVIDTLKKTGLKNFVIEIANECNIEPSNGNGILKPDGIIELMNMVSSNGMYVGSSLAGGSVPDDNMIAASNFVLLHGNGQQSSGIASMISRVKSSSAYKNHPKPIVFNEDDHYNFFSSSSNVQVALKNKVSWGLFIDCHDSAGDYKTGYQCVPTNWGTGATSLKQQYFDFVKSVTQ